MPEPEHRPKATPAAHSAPTQAKLWVPGQRPDPATMSSEEYLAARVLQMRAELLGTDDLDKIPPLEPLLGDLLQMNTTARVNGPSGTFKSFLMLDMAGHIGTGMKWHGHYVRQGTVVYLVAEGEQGIRKRVRAWEQHHGMRMDNVLFLPRPVQAKSPEWTVFIELITELHPVFVVIDTQARVTSGIEENSAKEMGEVVDRMDDLRRATGACVGIVHHTGHVGEHGRGSSTVKGAMQSEIKVTRKGENLRSTVLTVKSSKQKDEDEDGDIQFGLRKVALEGEYKPDGRPVTSLVLESFDQMPEARRKAVEGSVEWIAQRLDEVGIPNDYGRRKLAQACQRLGFRAGNEKLNEVAKLRKDRSGQRSYPQVTETVPGAGTETEDVADQTGPGPLSGPVRTAPPAPVVPSSSVRRGPLVQAGPECAVCHNPLDADWAARGYDRHVTC